jgi:hypothetical protein
MLQVRPGAKECNLEAERVARLVEPAGDVPPLDPEIGMGTLVAREAHLVARHHLRERREL